MAATGQAVVSASRKGAETRQRVLDSAARLFSRRGYAGTSIRDISQACGLKAAAIYHYFASKEDLLLAVETEAFAQLTAIIDAAIKVDADPWERLESACTAHLEGVLRNREFINVTIRELPENHSALVRQKLRYLREQYENIFRNLVNALPLDKRHDASLFRLTLLGAMAWSMVWYRAELGPPGRLAAEMLRLLRFGVESENLFA